jgi:hypothetical protein
MSLNEGTMAVEIFIYEIAPSCAGCGEKDAAPGESLCCDCMEIIKENELMRKENPSCAYAQDINDTHTWRKK